MNVHRKYFGTDGMRGVANVAPLDPETLVRLGKAIAKVLLKQSGRHRVLIGKDTRLSGYMIETALAAGITSAGADVLLVGPIPTPGVSYLTRSMRAQAGIMISASHNPYEDNGIKIFGGDGFKLADDMEAEIEAMLDLSSFMQAQAAQAKGVEGDRRAEEGTLASSDIGKATRISDALGRYTVYLKNCFARELTLEGLKLGLDCANGAAYLLAPQTFSELGAEVVSRGVSPNGRNINAGFGSLYPEIVRKLVLEHNLDIGIALDGDADRAILVDEKGNVLDGDMILALCAIDLKKRGLLRQQKVVATVMSNLGLEKVLNEHGIQVERVQVGDRYVLERMLQIGSQLGGEQSGHLIFSNESYSGDGTLTALMALAVMQREGKTLSELNSGFQRFPQKIINIDVASKPPLETITPLQKLVEEKEQDLRDTGRLLIRYSGTENKVRVMVECEDDQACKKHAEDLADVLRREIGNI